MTTSLVSLFVLFAGGFSGQSLAQLHAMPDVSIIVQQRLDAAPTAPQAVIKSRQWVRRGTTQPVTITPKVTTIVSAPTPAPQSTTTPAPAPVQQAPATTVTTTATTDLASQIEQLIHTKINAERAKNNQKALSWDTKLATLARTHSADMLKNNYFSHTDLNGCSSSCRVTNSGYQWSSVGENIYMMSGYNLDATGVADMIVNGWMNSPGHKANILNTSFSNEGLGVAVEGTTIYATEDFALPR